MLKRNLLKNHRGHTTLMYRHHYYR
jgi:hypothetical protein